MTTPHRATLILVPYSIAALFAARRAIHLIWVGLALGNDGNPIRANVEMFAGQTVGTTTVELSLQHDAAGSTRGWAIRRGTCARAGSVLGAQSAYAPLRVDSAGKASAKANLALTLPDTGDYHVIIAPSATERRRMLACGNLVLED